LKGFQIGILDEIKFFNEEDEMLNIVKQTRKLLLGKIEHINIIP